MRGGAATGIAIAASPTYASRARHSLKNARPGECRDQGRREVGDRVASSRSHRHGEDHALRPQVLDLCVALEGCESVEEDPALAPPPCGPGRNTPPWAESLRSVRQPLRKTPADPPCVSALTPPSFPSGCDHHFYYQHDQHDQHERVRPRPNSLLELRSLEVLPPRRRGR